MSAAWIQEPVAALDEKAVARARRHQLQLTKPPGSLGRLETLAEQFAGWQGKTLPTLDSVAIRVFAADHGVARRGTSAFPQAVTAQMIANFCRGGAAICVLAREINADFAVVNLGCVTPVADQEKLHNISIGAGTADFTEQPAMSAAQCSRALSVGADQVPRCDLFIGGDMGIGNTTSAAALLAGLYQWRADFITGRGTGIDDAKLSHKIATIEQALALHLGDNDSPLALLQRLGGFEIAALTGAYIRCAQLGVPALVDGFISTAAAAYAIALQPGVAQWLLYSHQSQEAGHKHALAQLQARPLLALDMRLGEGSGAALAVSLIRQALALHNTMATFAQAGVSDAN